MFRYVVHQIIDLSYSCLILQKLISISTLFLRFERSKREMDTPNGECDQLIQGKNHGVDDDDISSVAPTMNEDGEICNTLKDDSNSLKQLLEWGRHLQATFGTSFLTLLTVIYWAQGFKSFSMLAVNYLLKDDFKLDPGVAQALITTSLIPWGIKPVYGILSDSLPLFGYRRRSYLFIGGVISFLANVRGSFDVFRY